MAAIPFRLEPSSSWEGLNYWEQYSHGDIEWASRIDLSWYLSMSRRLGNPSEPSCVADGHWALFLERVYIKSSWTGRLYRLTRKTELPSQSPETATQAWWWLDSQLKYRNWKRSRMVLQHKLAEKERITTYWTPLISTQKDETAVWYCFEKAKSFEA